MPQDLLPPVWRLSQQQGAYANITRYVARGVELGQPINVEMQWERVFDNTWYCGVGVLTVLDEPIPQGGILYAL